MIEIIGDRKNSGFCIRCGTDLLIPWNDFQCCDECTRFLMKHKKLAENKNTTIGVVATNATLTKEEANKVAQMAQNGLAKTINPTHTMLDGDTIFVLATNKRKSNVNIIGAFATQVVSEAILNAVKNAEAAGGLPSISQPNIDQIQ